MKTLISVIFFFLTTGLFLVSGCKKGKGDAVCGYTESAKEAPGIERKALLDSIEKYNIQGTMEHPSGLYYRINNKGSGSFVSNLCSSVSVTYRGGYFDGRGFDSSLTVPVTFTLGRVIVGWQKAIPLVSEGGNIDIYIPPSLAYGTQGSSVIPPNAYLVFKVTVTKIQ